jgi:hypothetical protein
VSLADRTPLRYYTDTRRGEYHPGLHIDNGSVYEQMALMGGRAVVLVACFGLATFLAEKPALFWMCMLVAGGELVHLYRNRNAND